jgi:hypothetical protein
MAFKDLTFGQVLRDYRADLLKARLLRGQDTLQVPVVVTNNSLAFDLISSLKTVKGVEKVSEATLKTIVGLVAKTEELIEEAGLIGIVKEELGDKWTDDKVKNLVDLIKKRIATTVTNSSISPMFLISALEEATSTGSLDNLNQMDDFNGLAQIVRLSQTLYGKIAVETDVSKLVTDIKDSTANLPAYNAVETVSRTFTLRVSAAMPVNLAYVTDALEKAIYGKTHFEFKDIVPVYVRSLEGMNGYPPMTLAEMMTAYIMLIYMVQQIELKKDTALKPVKDLVMEMLRGGVQNTPVVLREAGSIDFAKVKKFVTTLWADRITHIVSQGKASPTFARFEGLMNVRKYVIDNTFREPVMKALRTCSYVFDAMLDVAALVRKWIDDTGIYYKDVKPKMRERLKTAFFDQMKPFGEYSSNQNAPAFLREPALIIHHSLITAYPWSEPMTEPEVVHTDDAYDSKAGGQLITPEGGISMLITTGLIEGNTDDTRDAVAPWNPMIFGRFAQRWRPTYAMNVALPPVVSNPILGAYVRFASPSTLWERGLINYFSSKLTPVFYSSLQELSDKTGLPPAILTDALGTETGVKIVGDMALYDFERSLAVGTLLWDYEVLPFYDFMVTANVIETEGIGELSLLAYHPYASEHTVLAHNTPAADNLDDTEKEKEESSTQGSKGKGKGRRRKPRSKKKPDPQKDKEQESEGNEDDKEEKGGDE